jgi:hypothetical protein
VSCYTEGRGEESKRQAERVFVFFKNNKFRKVGKGQVCMIGGTGEGEARGVEGQVHQLLHDARNADNLCRMYVGWAAWL